MHAILIHGMGRSPLSMLYMGSRLKRAGLQPHQFGYFAGFTDFDTCEKRLHKFIEKHVGDEPYVLIGHSLGSVLIRSVLPKLKRPPFHCFFLAPPVAACRAAAFFQRIFLFRWFTGHMGRMLADKDFMEKIPIPGIPVASYLGVRGPRGRWFPLGNEPNDWLLSVSEATLPVGRIENVRATHTFIMFSNRIIEDIIKTVAPYKTKAAASPRHEP